MKVKVVIDGKETTMSAKNIKIKGITLENLLNRLISVENRLKELEKEQDARMELFKLKYKSLRG